jgi:hypothetical protein
MPSDIERMAHLFAPARGAGTSRIGFRGRCNGLCVAPNDAHARVPVNLDKLKSCFEEQHAILDRR